MATYNPSSLGIKAPSGGFQTGGWYSGRQYWNGTLSEPGQIHPSSNQQGAGQAVSQEVVQQTAPQNWNYIQQEQQKAQANPVQPAAPQPVAQPRPSAPTPVAGAGTGVGAGNILGNTPTINLPELYKSLTQSSGISGIQSNITNLERQYLEARNKISDNPFLAASTMDKKLQRLQNDYEKNVQPLKNEIAMKQADIEMQLNLESKQFDINSQQAQQALSQFNTLLAQGALDNVNGEDIAAIVRTTGLSSSMVQSAIQASIKSKQKDVKTQTIQWDDGTNMGYAVINAETGDIINKQTIGASTPTAAEVKAGLIGGGGGGGSKKSSQVADAQYLVTLYQNTNKSNPSWQKAHDLRNQYSPKDFYNNLLVTYPEASSYIKSIKGLFIK